MGDASTIAHHNLTLMTTDDRVNMERFLNEPGIRGLIWKRLDDTHALVDTERAAVLIERLKKLGFSPRFSRLDS